jgi:glyoxylase-like metal-dependent hydrolase (beta-lactamase superfamily II)
MNYKIKSITAKNSGPTTFNGTNTYVLGNHNLIIIDPGPDDNQHLENILKNIENKNVEYIIVTHTHKDHSTLANKLAEITGAKKIGSTKDFIKNQEKNSVINFDIEFTPDIYLVDQMIIKTEDLILKALHTPGHTSDHFCFKEETMSRIFTGDHIMGWSSTLISPPDGNMGDYMSSLSQIIDKGKNEYFPGHGYKITDGKSYAEKLLQHRCNRKQKIYELIILGDKNAEELTGYIYKDIDSRLLKYATLTILAHLIDLEKEKFIKSDGLDNTNSTYSKI